MIKRTRKKKIILWLVFVLPIFRIHTISVHYWAQRRFVYLYDSNPTKKSGADTAMTPLRTAPDYSILLIR
ncbi:hypothetical protein UB51_06280 [Paenibacillus sp. IHBB 10380]|nr:hypothetical protein UB51_06280 [Paenibacillus sp. IHBB 10380]